MKPIQTFIAAFSTITTLGIAVFPVQAKNPIPRCTSFDACRAFEGQQVEVVGIYTIKETERTKGPKIYSNVQIIFSSDKHGATLEPYWDLKSRRDAEEINRFQGRLVAVRGRYASLTPRNPAVPFSPSHFTMPTILEVDSIQLMDEKSP